MIYVTSDLHGRADHLKLLLDRVGFCEDDWLYILGDVIDRNGKGGVDILKWLIYQPNAELILGNHEQMLLSNRWVFGEINDDNIEAVDEANVELLAMWESNGGGCTMKALSLESAEVRQDILDYLDECPLIDGVSVGERDYLLVHSGLGNYSKDKRLRDYTAEELLWTRPELDTVYDPEKYTVIFGHTPTGYYSPRYKGRMIKTDSWWNIDTGAAMKDGSPMLLCLDSEKAYYIDGDGRVIDG